MDTKQFKKILNESISTNGNSIFEIKTGSSDIETRIREEFIADWHYALQKYQEDVVRKKEKEARHR